MAFIVEDGTGKVDANSYVSILEAKEYFETRQKTDWALLGNGAQQAALIEATEYIEGNYIVNVGDVKNTDQSLQFPRYNVSDCSGRLLPSDIIPDRLKRAVLILADQIGIQNKNLNAPVERQTTVETVGDITVEYAEQAGMATNQNMVTSLLDYLTCGGVERAGYSISQRFERG